MKCFPHLRPPCSADLKPVRAYANPSLLHPTGTHRMFARYFCTLFLSQNLISTCNIPHQYRQTLLSNR